MKMQTRLIVGVVASFLISAVIVWAAFVILKNMKTELGRIRIYDELITRANALNVLLATLKEGSNPSDLPQIINVNVSLGNLLKSLSSTNVSEEPLIRTIQKDNEELGLLLGQVRPSVGGASRSVERERREILDSQLWMKVRHISDETYRLRDMSLTRIVSAQSQAGIMVFSLLIALIFSNTLISVLSGRKVVAAERTLLEQREWLQVTLASIGDAVIATDTSGLVVFINPVALELTGRQAQEVLGQPIQEIFRVIDERTRREAEDIVGRVLREGRIAGLANHTVLISRCGREIPIEDSAAPIKDSAGNVSGVVLVFHDVTERRQAMETFQRYELLAANSRDIVLFTQCEDGRILEANAAAVNAYGYGRDELLELTIYDLQSLDDKRVVGEQTAKAYAEGILFETVHRRKDGTFFPAEVSSRGATIESTRTLISVVRDITKRKLVEEALRQSEEKFRLAFENANTGMCLVDLQGRLLQTNAKMSAVFGYGKAELEGMSVNDLAYPDDAAVSPAFIRRAVEGGGDSATFEKRYRHRQGHVIIGEVASSLVRDGRGQPRCFISQVQDITDRKRGEERIRKLTLVQASLHDPGTLHDKLKRITDGVVDMFDADFARIWLMQPGDLCQRGCVHADVAQGPHACLSRERCLHLAASSGRYTHLDGEAHRRVPFGCYKIGRIASGEEKSFLTNDVASDQRIHNREWAKSLGLVSFAGSQLRPPQGETTGVLALFSKHPISSEEEALLRSLSNLVVPVIQTIRAEEMARENEMRLNLALEGARAGVWDWDLVTDKHIWSETQEALFGYASGTFPGTTDGLTRRIHPDDLPGLLDVGERAKTGGGSFSHEYRVVRPDGSMRWVLSNGRYLFDAQGQPIRVAGVLFDITERKQAEDALRENDRKLKEAQRIANMGYWELDLTSKELLWSDEVYRIFEIDPNEFTASYESFLESLHPDDREAVVRTYYASLENRTSYDIEHRLLMKDGRVKYVHERCENIFDAAGQPLRSIGTVQDVTDHRLTENELKEALLFNKHIIDSALEGIIVYDRDLRYRLWNPFMEKLTGLKPSDVLGKTPSDLFPFMVESGVVDDIRKVLNGETVEAREFRDQIPDSGRSGWVVQANAPLRNSRNEVIGVLGMVRDVTEQKKTTEQLRQAQKMESIGRLAGGVAHDFNNMLGVIIGHADIALDELDPTQRIYVDLQEIRKAAQRSADLTRQLLAFARKQTISPRVLDLNDTVEGMLKMLRRLIGEDIDLLWKPGPALWPVKVDPSQIDQILANLAVNARDAIVGLGKVTIETDNVVLDRAYCRQHPGFMAGEHVLLAVTDDGCGMDKEVLENLFEPFFTTKGLGKGTGLGLATVYGIVRQNNGFINVYSEPGHGTVFKIYLPRSYAGAPKEELSPREKMNLKGTETVLLVEDEEGILALGKVILERHGYRVLGARKPSDAISLAENHMGPIHILITDVVMPGMNGKDLNEKLRQLKPDLKCIFMSGYTANVIAHHGILDEGINFLQKPFSVKSMTEKVRQVLDS